MVARLRARIERAAALHRHTMALVSAAAPILDAYAPAAAPAGQYAEQHDLAASLRSDAAALAPGWLGAQLDAMAPSTSLGGPLPPTFVRVGQAHPLDDARFSVVVPLLRAGHIAIDADARDSRVAGLLRSLVLRLLASSPPGSVRIRAVDSVGVGATFGWFTGIDAIMPPPATDAEGLRAVLDEGERWIAARTGDGAGPTLLIVIASLPELTEGRDLSRIAALAHAGPAGRLHLIAAGWPPPPLTAETTQAPLPHATQIAIRNPHAWVGDPPGATFSGTGIGPGRLNAPVFLDPDPPVELIRLVCAQLSGAWTAPPMPVGEPSRTAWLDYIAAAQRLDTVRRDAITVVGEHKAALKAARDDLAGVQAKLAHHQAQLTEAARQAGGRTLEFAPTWQETQAAQAALAGAPPVSAGRRRSGAHQSPPSPPLADPATGQMTGGWMPGPRTAALPVSAPPWRPTSAPPMPAPPIYGPPIPAPPMPGSPVSGIPAPTSPATGSIRPVSPPAPESVPGRVSMALRVAAVSLKQSEADLVEPGRPAVSPGRVWGNAAVYFGFTLLATLVQVPMLLASEWVSRISLLALPCAVVLPAMAFGLSWLTIGVLSKTPTSRTPLLGAAISLLALVPVLMVGGALLIGNSP